MRRRRTPRAGRRRAVDPSTTSVSSARVRSRQPSGIGRRTSIDPARFDACLLARPWSLVFLGPNDPAPPPERRSSREAGLSNSAGVYKISPCLAGACRPLPSSSILIIEALVSSTAPLLHTPLHEWHQSHGGRLVEFGGWSMPVQYTIDRRGAPGGPPAGRAVRHQPHGPSDLRRPGCPGVARARHDQPGLPPRRRSDPV